MSFSYYIGIQYCHNIYSILSQESFEIEGIRMLFRQFSPILCKT